MGNKQFNIRADNIIADSQNIVAIGSVKLAGDWNKLKISLDNLKRIISIFESLNISSSENNLEIIWTKDLPIMIGKCNDEGVFNGVLVAPIVTSNERKGRRR